MRRREFIKLVGSGATAAIAAPRALRAQQPAMPVVGFLNSMSRDLYADQLRAFHEGLNQAGYFEGRNVTIEYRWAEGQNDRLPALAADLVRRQVSVIVTANATPPALAAKAATSTIPIVFTLGSDPVKAGLVESLNRPGGNLTGITGLGLQLMAKRLELLREVAPKAALFSLLINPTTPIAETISAQTHAAAHALGVELEILHASSPHDFPSTFATLVARRTGGLVLGIDPLFTSHRKQLGALTVRSGLPAIYTYRDFALAGGLMSYGTNFADSSRFLGLYTARILKGEKPADLPVQQATRVELIINLKTAKALGLTMPTALLVRADEVIE